MWREAGDLRQWLPSWPGAQVTAEPLSTGRPRDSSDGVFMLRANGDRIAIAVHLDQTWVDTLHRAAASTRDTVQCSTHDIDFPSPRATCTQVDERTRCDNHEHKH